MVKDTGGIRTNIQSKFNLPLTSNVISSDNYCKDNIIPEYLLVHTELGWKTLTSGLKDNPYVVNLYPPKWKDGTEMVVGYYGDLDNVCRVGSRTGENVNYLYCDSLSYSNTTQKLSDTGQIQGYETRAYHINLTIEKEPYKKEQLQLQRSYGGGYFLYYKVVDSKCKKI